jgi:hypothetical protein
VAEPRRGGEAPVTPATASIVRPLNRKTEVRVMYIGGGVIAVIVIILLLLWLF